ncbi:unnamed protein product [Adineta steineri]|uniref:Uncharacterized protein n=1 Tax=Adineta steineri TaxID=433720 RepID=A0A819TPC7_9BILA|nr:unnamed protein product [Adineta steineri]CAF4068002.1 unnamed protein product [Adineta steineri]
MSIPYYVMGEYKARPTLSSDHRAFENLIRMKPLTKLDTLSDLLIVIKELRLAMRQKNIVTKFRNELELTKMINPRNSNNNHIRTVEFIVKYLSEDMKSGLEAELKYYKKDINIMAQDNKNQLD